MTEVRPVFVLFGVALCLSCTEQERAIGPRLGVPEPTVTTYTDGCARFQIRFDDGVAQVINTMPSSGSCTHGELRLTTDTAAVFDAASGRLRIGVVLQNQGTKPIVAPVRLRFDADSVVLLNANQTPFGVPSNLLSIDADSLNATGRRATWFMDLHLASSGQPQVLLPGASSIRRWIEFGGTTWAPRVRIKIQLFGAELSQLVPAVPPDSTPSIVYLPSETVSLPTHMKFVRDLLVIQFSSAATQAQKQSLIDSLGGIVVGGIRGSIEGGGYYYVRLPQDATHARLGAAELNLRSHPAVRRANRYYRVDVVPNYLFPADGPDWSGTDWRPDTSLSVAQTGNWALRLGKFPLAWGCSTGDSAVRVGVLDIGFKLIGSGLADIAGNIVHRRGADLVGDTVTAHGSWVTSVLGARGNNGVGITGAAWRVGLDVVDPTGIDVATGGPRYVSGRRDVSYTHREIQLDSLIRRGSRIISFSLGADTSTGAIVDLNNASQVDQARTIVGYIADNAQRSGGDPLFVVSAGNLPGADPRSSVYPYLKDSIATLVVGAMNKSLLPQYAPPPGSPYLDVLAPGEDVGILLASGAVGRATGSSVAVPQVAGLAALILSFDPRLTAAELRQLIIQGAINGGRTAGGYPVIDAYESLKLAAQRPGAPLCGNRLWTDGADLWTRRSTGGEKIGADSGAAGSLIQTFHGGKDVIGKEWFRWSPAAGWQAQTTGSPDLSRLTGSYHSLRGFDHDMDFAARAVGSGNPPSWRMMIQRSRPSDPSYFIEFPTFSFFAALTDVVHVALAYPPIGDTALVSVSFGAQSLPTFTLTSASVYKVSLSTQQHTLAWTESGRGVRTLAYSEDGAEVTVGVTNSGVRPSQPATANAACKVVWRNARTATPVDSASTPFACVFNYSSDSNGDAKPGGASSARVIVPPR
ncbi:MAG: S8 family peptidase [Gemmatimonadota bacterium]